MNRFSVLASCVLAVSACGGTNSKDDVADAAVVDPTACPRVCKKLAAGDCGFSSSAECGQQCTPYWRECPQWPALLQCMDAWPDYACGTGASPCSSELAAVILCASDAGTGLLDCVPGSTLPPCECDGGGQGSGGICPPSGKRASCCT